MAKEITVVGSDLKLRRNRCGVMLDADVAGGTGVHHQLANPENRLNWLKNTG